MVIALLEQCLGFDVLEHFERAILPLSRRRVRMIHWLWLLMQNESRRAVEVPVLPGSFTPQQGLGPGLILEAGGRH
jgi:hypothetical protein